MRRWVAPRSEGLKLKVNGAFREGWEKQGVSKDAGDLWWQLQQSR